MPRWGKSSSFLRQDLLHPNGSWQSKAAPFPPLDIQHRNTLNTATLHSQLKYLNAGAPSDVFTIPVNLGLNERLRIVVGSDYVGDAQVGLLTSL